METLLLNDVYSSNDGEKKSIRFDIIADPKPSHWTLFYIPLVLGTMAESKQYKCPIKTVMFIQASFNVTVEMCGVLCFDAACMRFNHYSNITVVFE